MSPVERLTIRFLVPGPVIVVGVVMFGSWLTRLMIPVALIGIWSTSALPLPFAAVIAARSESAPASSVLSTGNSAALAPDAQTRLNAVAADATTPLTRLPSLGTALSLRL